MVLSYTGFRQPGRSLDLIDNLNSKNSIILTRAPVPTQQLEPFGCNNKLCQQQYSPIPAAGPVRRANAGNSRMGNVPQPVHTAASAQSNAGCPVTPLEQS
jgi:hypothetical protein